MSNTELHEPHAQSSAQGTAQSEARAVGALTTPIALAFEELKLKVEAILFASDRPLEVAEIREFVGNVSLTDVRLALKDLGHDFETRSVQIIEVGRRFQLRTKSTYTETVSKLFAGRPRSLSRAALETLAIVAYRQPVTRAEVAALRQVDSSHLISALKEKELICASGTRKEVGNPVEYRTTPKFLDVFGLASLDDLPRLRSLQMNPDDAAEVRKALEQFDAGMSSGETERNPEAADLNFIEADETTNQPDERAESGGGAQSEEVDEPEAASPPLPASPSADEPEPLEVELTDLTDVDPEPRDGARSAPVVLFAADEDSAQPGSDDDHDPDAKVGRLHSVESLVRPVGSRGRISRSAGTTGERPADTPVSDS